MSSFTTNLKEYSYIFDDAIGAKEFTKKIEQFENYLKSLDTTYLKRKYIGRVLKHTDNSYLFRSEIWDIAEKEFMV